MCAAPGDVGSGTGSGGIGLGGGVGNSGSGSGQGLFSDNEMRKSIVSGRSGGDVSTFPSSLVPRDHVTKLIVISSSFASSSLSTSPGDECKILILLNPCAATKSGILESCFIVLGNSENLLLSFVTV